MVKALATAQVQSVREINKQADIKKTNKKVSVIVVIFFVLLIVGFIAYKGYNYYQLTRFDFKEQENGINFYSKDMSVRDALFSVVDSNKVVISVNTILDDSNSVEDATDSLVLITTILSAQQKETTIVANALDDKRQLVYCTTNLGDVYTNEDLNSGDCLSLINNAESLITIDIPNNNLTESVVNIYPLEKRIQIKPKTKDDMLISSYLILKSNYPELEKTLSKIEAIKKKLSDMNAITNTVSDQNLIDSNS